MFAAMSQLHAPHVTPLPNEGMLPSFGVRASSSPGRLRKGENHQQMGTRRQSDRALPPRVRDTRWPEELDAAQQKSQRDIFTYEHPSHVPQRQRRLVRSASAAAGPLPPAARLAKKDEMQASVNQGDDGATPRGAIVEHGISFAEVSLKPGRTLSHSGGGLYGPLSHIPDLPQLVLENALTDQTHTPEKPVVGGVLGRLESGQELTERPALYGPEGAAAPEHSCTPLTPEEMFRVACGPEEASQPASATEPQVQAPLASPNMTYAEVHSKMDVAMEKAVLNGMKEDAFGNKAALSPRSAAEIAVFGLPSASGIDDEGDEDDPQEGADYEMYP